MEEFEEADKKAQLKFLLETKDIELIREAVEEYPPAVIVEILEDESNTEIVRFLKALAFEESGRIFSELPIDRQYELSKIIEHKLFSEIFTNMYSDLRADLFQEMSKEEQIELLPYLDKKTREDVIVLSAYDPETAGGIMNTDFATILIHMTCKQALAKVRHDAPSQKMIYYIYVVNDEMEMLGIVTIKDLIMADPKDIVREIINDKFVFVDVNDDREKVAQMIEKYDLVAIPVLNKLNQLVGIVSHEEAIDIIRAEHTEDMEKFMGIVPSEDEQTYLGTSALEHFKKRVVWLVALAAVGLISGVIIHHYQNVLEQLIILALYMPMMTATGGNTGSQAATVVIRAMALDQASEKEWLHIILKEAQVSAMLSICVGGLVFIKIRYLTSLSLLPEGMSFAFIGFIIALAIAMQVVTSAIVGAGLPILVRRLGGDPAVAASPAITTTVDITGLLIYFSIASYALNLV
ncbi:MAG: magnesium transporter [Halobacteriovoraceae bacterium]|nr:magnesium transporter [Halobacteriovoraceae bacterium]|tara:strand:+ start:1276 stop:2667 length:1392 start_codon:yes stop_codon:yes gene_type:complete